MTKKGRPRKNRRRKRILTSVSKERRLANERERQRLQRVNAAFTLLRSVLPIPAMEGKNHHIPKVEVVRMACRHIALLTDILRQDGWTPGQVQSPHSTGSECSQDLSDDEPKLNSESSEEDEGDTFADLALPIESVLPDVICEEDEELSQLSAELLPDFSL